MNPSIRVALAIRQPVFRHGLIQVLSTAPEIRIVPEADAGIDIIDVVVRTRPDVLLVDVHDHDGALSALKKITADCGVRVVALVNQVDIPAQTASVRVGARCLLQKDSSGPTFVEAIRRVFGNESAANRGRSRNETAAPSSPNSFGLTRRELQIIAAVVEGSSNGKIADEFKISEETVRHHLTHIFDKVGTSTRLELAVFALTQGLLMLLNGLG